MAKKDEGRRTTEKARKPEKVVKTRTAGGKAPATVQRKATQRKGAHGKSETTFRLEAPQAARVFVAGCFNEWNPTANPLKRDEEGTWSCALAVEPGEHEYRFVVDGVWWDDPANTSRRRNDFGTHNCVLIVTG